MNYFLLIIILLISLTLNNAETVEFNSSITKTTWFWPLLVVCLALLFSVPCTLITVIMLCHKKKQLNDLDESSISSNSSLSSSSSSSTSVQRRLRHNRFYPQLSRYAGGYYSPPPPYRTTEQPENLFVTSSLPPSYESHSTDANPSTTIINIENQSLNNPRIETILDVSSIQTLQV